MKKLLINLVAFTALTVNGQSKFQLLSPDKTIRIEIQMLTRLSYSVFVDDKKILDQSVIDMNLTDGRSLSHDFKKTIEFNRSVHEIIVAQVPYSRKNIPDEFNETLLQFNNHFAVIFRAYNDGVSYRISTSFKDSFFVSGETAGFRFANNTHAYAPLIQKRDDQDIFHTSFEELYQYKKLDSLSGKDFMYSPVLLKTTNEIFVALTESDLDD